MLLEHQLLADSVVVEMAELQDLVVVEVAEDIPDFLLDQSHRITL
tara:strand:- start:404 stop:538 length:135 start_codon:yes stop_codon:yes gene_type:complete